MTLPYERARAVRQTELFLIELLNPEKTPGVPENIRQSAKHLLRHYPNLHNLEMVQLGWSDDCAFEVPFKTKDEFFGELK
jgi:hypothetical protein